MSLQRAIDAEDYIKAEKLRLEIEEKKKEIEDKDKEDK